MKLFSRIKQLIKHFVSLTRRNQQIILIVYLVSVAVIKLPPFTIFFPSKFTSSLTLAKLVILGFFSLCILGAIHRKPLLQGRIFYLLAFLMATHSLSIINANDLFAFFRQYQNVVLNIVLFISAYLAIQTDFVKKTIFRYILVVGTGTISLELFFLLFPQVFITITTHIFPIQNDLMDLYLFNYYTLGRYNLYLQSELFIPFFSYILVSKKSTTKAKIISIIAISLLFVLTITSKFRTRFLQAIFAVVSYVSLLRLNLVNIVYSIFVAAIILGGFTLTSFLVDHTIFDRILYADSKEDVGTVSFRIDQFTHAVSLASAYPLFGVGLGNFKEYTDHTRGLGIRDYYQKQHFTATVDTPHSIFSELISETGILGTMAYLIVILYFFVNDAKYFSKLTNVSSNHHVPFIIASWTVFMYGVINPFTSVFLSGWFWFLRGILEGSVYGYRESTK